jgi:hypothetical protein
VRAKDKVFGAAAGAEFGILSAGLEEGERLSSILGFGLCPRRKKKPRIVAPKINPKRSSSLVMTWRSEVVSIINTRSSVLPL